MYKALIFSLAILVLMLTSNFGFSMDFSFISEFGGKGTDPGDIGKTAYFDFDTDGNIYVADESNRIQKFSPEGELLLEIKADENVKFYGLKDIAVSSNGDIYVADKCKETKEEEGKPKIYLYGACVHRFDSQGNFIKTINIDEIKMPEGLTPVKVLFEEGKVAFKVSTGAEDRKLLIDVFEDNLFVLDIDASSFSIFDKDGNKVKSFGSKGDGDGQMDGPVCFSIDNNGIIYVTDKGNNRIVKFDKEGNFISAFGKKGKNNGEIFKPVYLEVTPGGVVFVKDEFTYEKKFEDHPFTEEEGGVNIDYLGASIIRKLRSFTYFSPYDDYIYQQDPQVRDLEEKIDYLEKKLEMSSGNRGVGNDKAEEEEEEPEPEEKYTRVFERIQKFSPDGEFLGLANFVIDKNDEELTDLVFQALDNSGNVYYRDKSSMKIRKYEPDKALFLPHWSDWDRVFATGGRKQSEVSKSDGIDPDPLVDYSYSTESSILNAKLVLNFDPSHLTNIKVSEYVSTSDNLSKRESSYDPYNDYQIKSSPTNSFLTLSIGRILNINPFKFRAISLDLTRIDAGDITEVDYLNPLNKQLRTYESYVSSWLTNFSWDLARDMNISVNYEYLDPYLMGMHRKYTRIDDLGRVYDRGDMFNKYRLLEAIYSVKF